MEEIKWFLMGIAVPISVGVFYIVVDEARKRFLWHRFMKGKK